MDSTNPPKHDFHRIDWQPLGEIDLDIRLNTSGVLQAWLQKILGPFNLNTDFLNRVQGSARESVSRIVQEEIGAGLEHIHLLVFITPDDAPTRQTWGFFKIEKMGTRPGGVDRGEFFLEYYLFVDRIG